MPKESKNPPNWSKINGTTIAKSQFEMMNKVKLGCVMEGWQYGKTTREQDVYLNNKWGKLIKRFTMKTFYLLREKFPNICMFDKDIIIQMKRRKIAEQEKAE